MPIEIKMPKLSPTMESGVFGRWTMNVGDAVKSDSVIAEIETDKAIMEIEALTTGVLGFLSPVEGQEIVVNEVIGFILKNGEEAPSSWEDLLKSKKSGNSSASSLKKDVVVNNVSVATESITAVSSLVQENANVAKSNERIFVSPLAKKIAKDENIDLGCITGSGPNGRIVKADLAQWDNIKDSCSSNVAQVNVTVSNSNKDEFKGLQSQEIPLSGMRKVIAQRLTESFRDVPHFYMEKKIKMDAIEKIKQSILDKFGRKLSLTPFFIKAVALALKDNPSLNRTFENGKMLQHYNSNITIAIAIDGGILVPVIQNADRKNISQIADELINLSSLAKEGKLQKAHSECGTFSISNLGMFGIDSFEAIINPPQVGILAIAATGVEAVFDGEKFIPKKVMKCTLSCDHRIVDGADGAKFMQSFASYIENPEGMLL